MRIWLRIYCHKKYDLADEMKKISNVYAASQEVNAIRYTYASQLIIGKENEKEEKYV